MKKIIISAAVILSLVLLLGSISPKPNIYDPNSKDDWGYCSASRSRIVKYEVIVASDPNKLQEKVEKRLKEWIPIGGVSVCDSQCYQAMVVIKD